MRPVEPIRPILLQVFLLMSRCSFITPLPREQLFDPGTIFPAHELTRRVLSLFWRDCCCPPYFSRAPAPVIQLYGTDTGADLAGAPRPLHAWWLMDDGIVEESEGPHSERLKPFFRPTGAKPTADTTAQLWPRYEFRVLARPFEVEMSFYRDGQAAQGHRTRLLAQPDGRVRVLARSEWWVG